MPDIDLELYERAFQNTENPAIITDTNYVIRDVNQACIEFTGYPREELIDNVPLMLFSDPDIYEDLIGLLENDEPWQGYFEAETKDGYHIYGRGSAIPLIVDGEKQGYSGIFVDLTERRQYEQALQVIHRVLRHDLRNEMNLMLGYLQTIDSDVSPADADWLAKAKDVGEQLVRRADKARHLEQLLYGGVEKPKTRVELGPILRSSVENVRQQYPSLEIVETGTVTCDVMANELLEQVIESILENAVIHHGGAENPRVEIDVKERETDVIIAIADDGPGIPDDRKDEVFGREETDEVHHGEGFSLYFVDVVMNLYRGSVDVVDNERGGATFEIQLQKPSST